MDINNKKLFFHNMKENKICNMIFFSIFTLGARYILSLYQKMAEKSIIQLLKYELYSIFEFGFLIIEFHTEIYF